MANIVTFEINNKNTKTNKIYIKKFAVRSNKKDGLKLNYKLYSRSTEAL